MADSSDISTMPKYDAEEPDHGSDEKLLPSSESEYYTELSSAAGNLRRAQRNVRITAVVAGVGWVSLAWLLFYVLVYPSASCNWILPTPVYCEFDKSPCRG